MVEKRFDEATKKRVRAGRILLTAAVRRADVAGPISLEGRLLRLLRADPEVPRSALFSASGQ